MCGIAGFTGAPNAGLLHKMCVALIHRGPDDKGYKILPQISLGMRRLSVVDIHEGQQPITNENEKVWIVFNGEIYGHHRLKEELISKGHLFSTNHSDTEVLVHLYEEYGDDLVSHINGMFSFAIWDINKQRLLLSRDRCGKKPLYYSIVENNIYFASEIKALLQHPFIPTGLNYNALYHYFGNKNISAPDTAYKHINQLLPGHQLVWQHNKASIKPYWEPDFRSFPSGKLIHEDDAANTILHLLSDAVKERMTCDVPYGAYLSGGLDSSAVVSLMSQYQTSPVKTFCLGYEDEVRNQFVGKAQDIHYARIMAKKLGTEHHEYIIGAQELVDSMQKIICAFDEPFSGTISTFFLSRIISKHVKVALSGDGADELFGSYLTHRLSFPMEYLLQIIRDGRGEWQDITEEDKELLKPFATPEQFSFLKRIAHKEIAKWRGQLAVFTHSERKQLLSDDFNNNLGNSYSQDTYEHLSSKLTATDALNKTLEMDQAELLPNQILPFVDRLSMAHSIEVRCPFLDYRLVEYVNRLPGKYKINGGVNKYILKKALTGLLPHDLINRPKEGFVQPIYSWMHGSLKDWVLSELQQLPDDIFNQSYIENIIQQFISGDRNINAKIWNLTCFSLWYQNNNIC